MEPRMMAALCLSAASATTVAAALLVRLRQARAVRLRRRGIKSRSGRRSASSSRVAE